MVRSAITMAIAAAIALAVPATSGAVMGGAPMPGANPTQAGSASGAPAPEPSAGAIGLLEASTTPRRAFYFGYRYPRLHFSIASDQPENDLRIDVVNAAGEAVRTFYRNDVPPETARNIRWDGTDAQGRPVR